MATKFSETFTISVDSQGVNIVGLDREALKAWIKNEISFNAQLDAICSTQVIIENRNYEKSQNLGIVQTQLNKLAKLAEGESDHEIMVKALEEFVEPAVRGERLIADAPVSKYLLKLVSENKANAAHLPLLVYSRDFRHNHEAVQRTVEFSRAMILSPFHGSFANLYSASTANEASKTAKKLMSEELAEVKQLVEVQKAEMAKLYELYHSKLLFEEPAKHWQEVWTERTRQWRVALAVFALAILAPAIGLMAYGNAVIDLLTSLSPAGGQFSVAGLAVVTAPAILYAWLLRQISRIYTRSFDLAVDAAHRKALSITFLGLAENTKLGVDQIDRTIILQALFRPQPPNLSEDGPPIGLVELLKGKE